VRLPPYQQPPHPARNVKLLERLVNTAFQQRRKTLRNALKQLLPTEAIESLNIDTSVRPESITLAEFVALSDKLAEVLEQNASEDT